MASQGVVSPGRMESAPASAKNSSNAYRRASTNSDDDYVAECGIGPFRPAALRCCANMTAFTGFYSVCSLLTMTLTSYVTSQVTTLERHFGFSSSETGLIMAANDVGFLVVVLFVSYVASKVHIPRALGGVTALFGISGIVCSLPMFLFGAPSPSLNATSGSGASMTSGRYMKSFSGQLCLPSTVGNITSDCEITEVMGGQHLEMSRTRWVSKAALGIIVLGMVLQGFAKAPRSSFVTVYVDANVEKVKTGFYMGIITTVTIVGPALAYGLGGMFTRIYVTLQETDMTPRHPRWIGAWWLGYLVFGCAAILFSLPLFLFPRRTKRDQPGDEAISKKTSDTAANALSLKLTKDFLRSLKRLLVNPVYLCMVISACVTMFANSGAHSFGPKYMENLFSLPAWEANMAIAGLVLGTGCAGTLVGGWLTKKLQMGPMSALKFVLGVQLATFVINLPLLFLYCSQPLIYNSPGPRAAIHESSADCFEQCACDDNDFLPICGSDMHTYYSPCHAGCVISSRSVYSNCTCISGGQAVPGHCDYSCPMFYIYMVLVAFNILIGTSVIIPKLIILIRCVEERDKSMSLGFNSFAMSITGWMLGPLVFGKVIDFICIQWESTCYGRGTCRLYDNDQLRYQLQGVQLAAKGVCILLTTVAILVAKFRRMFPNEASPTSGAGALAELSNMVSSSTKVQE